MRCKRLVFPKRTQGKAIIHHQNVFSVITWNTAIKMILLQGLAIKLENTIIQVLMFYINYWGSLLLRTREKEHLTLDWVSKCQMCFICVMLSVRRFGYLNSWCNHFFDSAVQAICFGSSKCCVRQDMMLHGTLLTRETEDMEWKPVFIAEAASHNTDCLLIYWKL